MPQVTGCQIWAVGGQSHLGDLMFHQNTAPAMLSQWSCQSPVASSCGLLNHPNSLFTGMFKLNSKRDADLLLYLVSHFECDGHTVHRLTQGRVPPPVTSAVKSSLFVHVLSSPLALAARLHPCHAICSHYINNGWAFPGQTSHIYMAEWFVM